MNQNKTLTKKLQKLFDTNDVFVKSDRDTVQVEFRYRDTSFDDLSKLSKYFGTKNINMGSEVRHGGYCETCSYSYTVNIVTIRDITKNLE